jgi:hypothetical protein
MSHDGGYTYDDVYGYASVAAYVDSVVNFDCYGTGWSWDNIECPFDDTLSMGFRVEEYMWGVLDEPSLANVVIYQLDITNRNPDSIVGLQIGAFHDFDLENNSSDQWLFDADHSIAWGASCSNVDVTNTKVYGWGMWPIWHHWHWWCWWPPRFWGVRTLDAEQAMWHADYVALDSMYYWMTNEPGATYQVGIDPNFPCDPASESADRDAWMSYTGYDFGGHETRTLGLYMFGGIGDVTDDQYYVQLAATVSLANGTIRGHMNMDHVVNLADVVLLYNMLYNGGPGPLFEHTADVNGDGVIDGADVLYLANYAFCLGDPPVQVNVLPNICP